MYVLCNIVVLLSSIVRRGLRCAVHLAVLIIADLAPRRIGGWVEAAAG
jgi:hypothetical protein